MVSMNSFPGVFFTHTNDEVQIEFDSLWNWDGDWPCQSLGLLERLCKTTNSNVAYYTKSGTSHGISFESEFFAPNAEGISPHDFVLDAVNRKICCYKNFSADILNSCEYEVSDVCICAQKIADSQSHISYVLFGVA